MTTSATAQATRQPLTLRQAESMLSYVDGYEDREQWIAVGMALKSEFGPEAFDAWDRWSSNAANYSAKACKASWKGFKSSSAGGVGIGTLVKLAKDGGFRFAKDDAPTPDELQALAAKRAQRAAAAKAEKARRAELAGTAMQRAHQAWHQASREGVSTYAERKLVHKPESVRFTADGGLLVPMLRYDLPREQALKGVQTIAADGTKRFTPGMEKAGTACRLGLVQVGQPVFVAEGWATAASIRQALGYRFPVFVAFDAYNLPLVVEYIWQTLPACPLVVCADDDHATLRNGLPHNVGRIQAQVAMDAVMETGARLVARTHPIFQPSTPRTAKDTDFNDLHRLEGLPAVAEAMQTAIDCLEALRSYA